MDATPDRHTLPDHLTPSGRPARQVVWTHPDPSPTVARVATVVAFVAIVAFVAVLFGLTGGEVSGQVAAMVVLPVLLHEPAHAAVAVMFGLRFRFALDPRDDRRLRGMASLVTLLSGAVTPGRYLAVVAAGPAGQLAGVIAAHLWVGSWHMTAVNLAVLAHSMSGDVRVARLIANARRDGCTTVRLDELDGGDNMLEFR